MDLDPLCGFCKPADLCLVHSQEESARRLELEERCLQLEEKAGRKNTLSTAKLISIDLFSPQHDQFHTSSITE